MTTTQIMIKLMFQLTSKILMVKVIIDKIQENLLTVHLKNQQQLLPKIEKVLQNSKGQDIVHKKIRIRQFYNNVSLLEDLL